MSGLHNFVERAVVSHSERFKSGSRLVGSSTKISGRARSKQTSKQRLASRAHNISLDVAALRQQLQQLQLHRSLLQTRALYTHRDCDGSAMKISAEYWNIFRHGYREDDLRQPAYLRSVMADDVHGLRHDKLLHLWKLYTHCFAIRRYEMQSLRLMSTDGSTGSCITRSEGLFFGSITRGALELAFPAVLRDPELTKQLLNKEMVVPISFIIHFNEDSKWSFHSGENDLFAGLSRALGDPVRAARILENAQIDEDGFVTTEPMRAAGPAEVS